MIPKSLHCHTNAKGFARITNRQIEFLGWIFFVVSAIGFCIASFGHFWSMFGSAFFLVACFVFLIPFFRDDKL